MLEIILLDFPFDNSLIDDLTKDMKRKIQALAVFLGVFLISYLLLYSPSSITNVFEQNKQNGNSDSVSTSTSRSENPSAPIRNETNTDEVFVTRVIDGDTIQIEGGQKVRYIGIDTPETVDPRTSVQCYGKEAAAKNRELVEGKRVRFEKDVSETDKYGRLLRYVFIGETFVNETLVRGGYAFSSPYPPDVKYQDVFNRAEKFAKENDKGLWGSCGFIAGAETKTTVPETDCVIKGNISSSSEKIYHLPGQKYYNQTVISESKGERWFCTETEAQKAGWRRSKL